MILCGSLIIPFLANCVNPFLFFPFRCISRDFRSEIENQKASFFSQSIHINKVNRKGSECRPGEAAAATPNSDAPPDRSGAGASAPKSRPPPTSAPVLFLAAACLQRGGRLASFAPANALAAWLSAAVRVLGDSWSGCRPAFLALAFSAWFRPGRSWLRASWASPWACSAVAPAAFGGSRASPVADGQ